MIAKLYRITYRLPSGGETTAPLITNKEATPGEAAATLKRLIPHMGKVTCITWEEAL